MKAVLNPDHMPLNNYELLVVGLPQMILTAVSGLEEEIQRIELPDKTVASGGRTDSTEFTITVPMHHPVENAALEFWLSEGKDPVLPSYKKAATLIYKSISGTVTKTYTLLGVWVQKRTLPDAEMDNEGEMATVEFTLSVDQIIPGA